MTTTAGDQINGALRLLGVLAEGETPSSETSQDALFALNQMFHHPGIYSIRNTKTGKLYIGSAVRISRRWDRHRHMLRNGSHHSPILQAAYNKYGAPAFDWNIIEYVDDKKQLLAREQFWLDFFNPVYNVSSVATSVLGVKRSDEARLRMSLAQKGKKQSLATIERRSAALKGHVVTDETRKKISSSHMGIRPSEATRAKQSAAKKGKKQAPEVAARRVAAIKAARLARLETSQ